MKKLAFVLYFIVGIIITTATYNIGYKRGASDGFVEALDTVIIIAHNQVRSDTTVTKLTLVTRDTVTFFLSRKTHLED